ncbi:MAG: hypothetical protein ACTSPV_17865 [Candidatus Hodarchaeales archaeon]
MIKKVIEESVNESILLTLAVLGFIVMSMSFIEFDLDPTISQNFLLISLGCFGAYSYLLTIFAENKDVRLQKVRRHVYLILILSLVPLLIVFIPDEVGLNSLKENPLLEVINIISTVYFTLFIIIFILIFMITITDTFSQEKKDSN